MTRQEHVLVHPKELNMWLLETVPRLDDVTSLLRAICCEWLEGVPAPQAACSAC